MTIQQILFKYWGYSAFRPLQEEIIGSVLEGKDTLALLPTGGGKSICYQVPALAQEGICLVVSPLIALMKDQVDNLKKRGIKAAAIHSGMHQDEVGMVISNCKYGDTKLLYVSPERLESDAFRNSLARMKVTLIAVDEAHCISQWGYDFRPPYLKIAEIRRMFPKVPLLALTATATPEVVKDIQAKLNFPLNNLFQQSFERKNLTYYVFHEEDKFSRLLKIIRKVKGTGIVYVRNRRKTKEIAEFLTKNNISADHYHAGLESRTREQKQNAWVSEQKLVMVSTNAFGMGIDKPNVRFVIHFDLPDCLEAYFQEAGRAGRDEKRAHAVLLWEDADILDARNDLAMAFPEVDFIRNTYQALGNFLQLPVGSGKDFSFDFDLSLFTRQYRLSPVMAFNALKLLEKEGYLFLNEAMHSLSRIFIKTDHEALYRFQVQNEQYDHFIKTILRSYTGIFTEFTPFNEAELGRRANMTTEKTVEYLKFLNKQKVLDYVPQRTKPSILFLQDRVDSKDLSLSPANYHTRMKDAEKRLEAVIRYVQSVNKCRSQLLLSYFGETQSQRCGKCDSCIERNKLGLNEVEFDTILNRIKPLLKVRPCSLEELIEASVPIHEEKVIQALQWLGDNEKVTVVQGLYKWKG